MPDPLERLRTALVEHYAIHHELGRGGMATVYLATDLRHRRYVALKVLADDVASAISIARFLREIEIAGRLNHPHILPLLDSGARDGLAYYTMPYVKGESLRDRLRREKQLPLDDAVRIACEVGDALSHAHAHGIIHRDIKPDNILLADGHARVADFGIARAVSDGGDGSALTMTGIVVGTPPYMSPEQIAGSRGLDERSDVYSLGCVLYEMLAGEAPYTGANAQAILAKRLREPVPKVTVLRETVPPHVERAIERALARTAADRFPSAEAFASALAEAEPSAAPAHKTTARRLRIAPLVLGGVALAAGAALVMLLVPSAPGLSPAFRQLTFSGDVYRVAISPDGRRIAYATAGTPPDNWAGVDRLASLGRPTGTGGQLHVLVRDVGGGTPDTLATLPSVLTLEWSTDGSRILVAGRRRAMVLSHLGGATRNIEAAADFPAYVLAHWLPDGARVSLHKFIDKHMLLVRLEDEAIDTIPFPGDYTWLEEGSWSPDGRRFAATTSSDDTGRWAIRIVNMNGHSQLLIEDTVPLVAPRWSSTADALYYLRNGQALFRLRLSRRDGGADGAPEELHSRLDALPGPTAYAIAHSVARDAPRMAYVKGLRFSNLWMVEADDEGRVARSRRLTTGTALRWSPQVSPDGQWIIFAEQLQGTAELVRMPIRGGTATQVTTGAKVAPHGRVAWSPAGDEVAFTSDRSGRRHIWIANANTGRFRVFENTRVSGSTDNLTWAPGAEIAYQRPGNRGIEMLDPASGAVRVLVADSTGTFHGPVYSPDGTQLALMWNRGPEDEALWLFEVSNSSRRPVQDPSHTPLAQLGGTSGWSGNRLLARGGGKVFRIDVTGAGDATLVLDRPFASFECVPVSAQEPSAFICASFERNSDVWMIENFDTTLR